MNIQITKPETEALIQQRLQSGRFADAEDLILHALRASESERATGADLVAAMQSSPFREEEIEPARVCLPVRDAAV
jgi:Arc/MetJ-type ribon-helix-helix transcriptional regulator